MAVGAAAGVGGEFVYRMNDDWVGLAPTVSITVHVNCRMLLF